MNTLAMNVWALGTVEAAADTLRLLAGRMELAGVIGLAARPSAEAASGYVFMEPVARELGLEFVCAEGYGLSSEADRRRLCGLPIDVLLVIGWQRLVPGWLIRHARHGAVGVHGSPAGISAGRGRSPQNWALLLGRTSFSLSLFFLDEAIDAGAVIATRTFPLAASDDIRSSYFKACLLTAEMIAEALRSGAITERRAAPQRGPAYYLPQRLPEDGAIDWRRTSRELHDFVRALTRPYPGAFSTAADLRLTLWRARPFELATPGTARPGEIVAALQAGPLLVTTGDGLLLVEEFDVTPAGRAAELRAGLVLESADFAAQMAAIVARHQAKYPHLPVSPEILRLAEGRRQAA